MKFARLALLIPLFYAVANAVEDAALSAAVAAVPPCAVSTYSFKQTRSTSNNLHSYPA